MMNKPPSASLYFAGVMAVLCLSPLATGCGAPPVEAEPTPYLGDGPDFPAVSSDFGCVSDYRRAGGLFLVNFLGLTEEAVQVAESETGGVYPVGTLVQGIPNEAMLKRGPGFSDATGDWEYIVLQNDGETTTITARGTTDVQGVGTTCAACHGMAEPQWDSICKQNRGCDPIPASDTLFQSQRDADRRCGRSDTSDD